MEKNFCLEKALHWILSMDMFKFRKIISFILVPRINFYIKATNSTDIYGVEISFNYAKTVF